MPNKPIVEIANYATTTIPGEGSYLTGIVLNHPRITIAHRIHSSPIIEERATNEGMFVETENTIYKLIYLSPREKLLVNRIRSLEGLGE